MRSYIAPTLHRLARQSSVHGQTASSWNASNNVCSHSNYSWWSVSHRGRPIVSKGQPQLLNGTSHVPCCQYPATPFSTTPTWQRDIFMPGHIVRSHLPDYDIPTKSPFHEIIFEKCDHYKDLPALSDFLTGKTYTYRQLKDKAIRVASALSRKGYKKGDIILVFTPNQVDYTVLMMATSCLGVCFSAANPSFTPEDLARQVSHSDSTAIFVHQVLAPVADAAFEIEGYPHKVKDRFVFGASPGYQPFETLMEDDGKGFPDVFIDPMQDLFVLPYSSGTTGLPKGVMLSHHNILANTLQIGESYRYVEGDNVLGLLPLYHIYGMTVIQFGSLFNGGHLHLLPNFEPQTFMTCMQNAKINTANLVPPLVLFMAKHPMVADYDLSALRSLVCGAAPLGKEISQALLERFDNRVSLQQGYGLTETSPVLLIDRHCIPGSAGDLLCNTQAKVIDLDSGESLGPNQDGELCVRGPQVMLGYYKNEEATRDMIGEDGWLHTGDIGHYEECGAFYINDRLKELIKYKGSQVAPAELEALLVSHPEVVDACVVGIPDERAGEVPKAFVVKKPDTSTTEDDIVQFIQGQVSDYKRLRGGVEFIQEIPKNASGKMLRRLLKK